MSVAELARAVDRLVGQVSHWQQARWAAAAGRDGGSDAGVEVSRSDQVYRLVQHLADRVAEVEGQPRRVVPRLDDRVLSDQLRVVARDLASAGAGEDVLAQAAGEVDAVRRSL